MYYVSSSREGCGKMTREEIIDGLEMYTVGRLKKERVFITVEELQKFIDEIKTLEQEPCEDCISRESIIEIVNHQRFGMSRIAFDIITEKLMELPSVTPKAESEDKI